MIKGTNVYVICNEQANQILAHFPEHGTYIYHDVPIEVISMLQKAKSVGSFINCHIRYKYEYVKC